MTINFVVVLQEEHFQDYDKKWWLHHICTLCLISSCCNKNIFKIVEKLDKKKGSLCQSEII